MQLLWTAWLSD